MTRYIEWGTISNLPGGLHRETLQKVDPTDLSTVQALWAALPPDLRLAMAKTAPRVILGWQSAIGANGRDAHGCTFGTVWFRKCANGDFACEAFESAGGYEHKSGAFVARVGNATLGTFSTLPAAQAACDAALIAQGYATDPPHDRPQNTGVGTAR